MESNAPVDAPARIRTSEYRERLSRVQAEMADAALDALFITSEDNFRWLTGFNAYCHSVRNGMTMTATPNLMRSVFIAIAHRLSRLSYQLGGWSNPRVVDAGVVM